MKQEFENPVFTKAFMTAVFVGIITTLITMFYDVFFAKILNFPLSAIINVSSLIFSVNLVFLVIGVVFYGFLSAFKKGELIYSVVFILLTVFLVWKTSGIHRTDDPAVNIQFRELLSGIIIIMGLLAAIAIPLLYHNKQFNEHVV